MDISETRGHCQTHAKNEAWHMYHKVNNLSRKKKIALICSAILFSATSTFLILSVNKASVTGHYTATVRGRTRASVCCCSTIRVFQCQSHLYKPGTSFRAAQDQETAAILCHTLQGKGKKTHWVIIFWSLWILNMRGQFASLCHFIVWCKIKQST